MAFQVVGQLKQHLHDDKDKINYKQLKRKEN